MSSSPPRGIVCPDCGVRLRTRRTVPVVAGVIRHRRCPKCGRAVTTRERADTGSNNSRRSA